ncbi:MAG: hypothetical protein WA687_07425 [Solirubrobacterales bacterium]
MRFGPIAAAAVLLSLALILPGCGEEGTATAGGERAAAESTAGGEEAIPSGATGVGETRMAALAARQCGRLLGDFLDAMESLGNTLAVGLDYDSYLGAVNHVRGAYAKVPADRLSFFCLTRVATPAEKALNTHIDAANAWGECLASSSCDPESVEPKLQRKWREASDLLSAARKGLRNLG